LKKVLILSYFFPPANFVGSERTAAWAKHLHKSGYHPIVITRQWNDGQTNVLDQVKNNVVEHELKDNYEIYRLPYRRSLRDRCSTKTSLRLFQKALTFWELLWSNYFIKALPYSNFYKQARKVLKENPEIKIVLASGRPFQQFSIGHQLKKEFDIKWIPDYRDEWASHKGIQANSVLDKFILNLERKSEKKWTSNADLFLSVSDQVVENISKHIDKKGFSVLNGYSPRVNSENQIVSSEENLHIVYSGTLYSYQNLDPFIDAVKQINSRNSSSIKVSFIGVNSSDLPGQRLLKKLKNDPNFLIISRMPKPAHDELLNTAHVLFLTSYEQNKGWYPVKLFDYYNTEKPILLCPSDEDVIEQFIKSTNTGYIAATSEECKKILESFIEKKNKGQSIQMDRNIKEGKKYSREYQTGVLGKILDATSNKN
jgi:glycosyltransferase involved in cell wall biosynthesis